LSKLINNLRNETETRLVRINSVNYLRSFIVRAKFLPFDIALKATDILISYLKSQAKAAKKKLKEERKKLENGDIQNSHYQDKIVLESSSKYKDTLHEGSKTEYEMKLRDHFKRFEYLYTTNHAIAYILCHKSEEFLKADTAIFTNYLALVNKYNHYLHIVEFLPINLLTKLSLIVRQNFHNDTTTTTVTSTSNIESKKGSMEISSTFLELIDFHLNTTISSDDTTETSKHNNNTKTEPNNFGAHRLLEHYCPFDPHFLPHSKKVLLPLYHFLDGEVDGLEDAEGENPNEDSQGNVFITDTLNEAELDVMSQISKHDTDTSNGIIVESKK